MIKRLGTNKLVKTYFKVAVYFLRTNIGHFFVNNFFLIDCPSFTPVFFEGTGRIGPNLLELMLYNSFATYRHKTKETP